MKGPVWIVGAGPGDPELITFKGARLLMEADLVLYAGSLVNPQVLEHCRDTCEKVDSSRLSLEDQVELMADRCGRGLKVVRLHTGDPSLYGAIGEQIRALEARGVECRIVPGVSSLQGAASALKIEYTVPGGPQTLVCTRLPGRTPVPGGEDLRVYASTGATLAIFLSSEMAQRASELCIEGGLDPRTPAAWVYRATWPDQRMGRTTLDRLGEHMASQGITRHALMVVGQCLDPQGRSLLYHPSFHHMYRKGAPED